ncbi:MAG: hypothetical protein PF693_04290 [Spirochaetia bacterium]|nr:hypothetical protein [Spirochaetia bacterium]
MSEIEDGFMLLYVKDGDAYPVPMSIAQWKILQSVIPSIMGQGTVKVLGESTGKVQNISTKGKD